MILARRSFLTGLIAAPVIICSSNLMLVKVFVPAFTDIVLRWADEAEDLETKLKYFDVLLSDDLLIHSERVKVLLKREECSL